MSHSFLQFGSIVHHDNLPDPLGRLTGNHFAVVLSHENEINSEDEIWVAGISTNYSPLNPEDGVFPIKDYIPGRPHPETGLSEACAVKLKEWTVLVRKADLTFEGKHISKSLGRQLQAWIDRL